ncbi:MAG: hypothetical protein IJQ06_08110 [Paludibacteraceae bacterium]|nr:hypothetical protein [Paludibacteraceae bacterium]
MFFDGSVPSSVLFKVAAQVQGVKTNLVQTYNLHLCSSATIKNALALGILFQKWRHGTEEKKKIIKIQKVSVPVPETTNLKPGTKIVPFDEPTQTPEMSDIYNISARGDV